MTRRLPDGTGGRDTWPTTWPLEIPICTWVRYACRAGSSASRTTTGEAVVLVTRTFGVPLRFTVGVLPMLTVPVTGNGVLSTMTCEIGAATAGRTSVVAIS